LRHQETASRLDPARMKKGCGDAAALLLEGLSLMCADRFASSGSPTRQKLFPQPFVVRHETVKGENDARARMFQIFPIRSDESERALNGKREEFAELSRIQTMSRDPSRRSPLGRGRLSATSMHCPAARRHQFAPDRLRPEQPPQGTRGEQMQIQFIPISTAILIRSE